ncbi:PAS domain S-box protein [Limnoglobus roseus]|uniref:histidine kinase n=1 Tax=Limnoglobus roseus TaxID=2598579 RepID=A0A5C1ACY9_9BACT|nr:PAS domain S-box protein [Limnoglobus roseus]QEL14918.1 PAS domain S-box protein [Limnoglobus roseus]
MRYGFDRGADFGIGLLAVLMVGIAATSFVNIRRLWDNADRVTRSRELIDDIHAVRFDTVRVQADLRVYLVTGFPETIKPYEASAARLQADAVRLAEQTADDPDQQPLVAAARGEIETGIAAFDGVVKLRGGPGGHDAVVALSRDRGSRSFVDPLLDTLTKMDRVERERLAKREDAAQEAYRSAIFYGIAAAGVGLVAVGLLVLTLARTARARTRDNQRVAEQRELLSATLSSIGDAVIATDAAGNVTFLNPIAERLTGWPQAEARGVPLNRVFHIVNESSRAAVENPAIRALNEGLIVGLANHTILIAKDGTEVPIDDSAAPIRSGGAVSGAVLVFRDITEKKRAEATQARLAAIVESSDDAVIGKTLDGTIESWNAGAERVFGYPAVEAVGRHITLIIPPDRLDEERGILERLRRGERIDHFETIRVTKSGSLVDISLTVSPIRDAAGHLIGASKIARDMTRMRAGERALAEARRRSETALQAGEVGTYYWDIAGDRVTGDRNFVAIFGVLADDRSSAPVQDFLTAIHPDDRERVGTEIRHTLETDSPFHSEYRVAGPAGERWVLARGVVDRDTAGKPVGWAGVLVDITRQREAERRLRASEERFRALFESMDEGYCVVEPILDGTGRAVDYRYLLANPALEFHTGLRDIVGKTAREVMPTHESHWIEAYARVAATGEPVRRTDRVEDLGRWFDVSAFRVGPGRVGVLFNDITARKQAEDAVRASEARLAEVFQHAPSFMGVLRGPDHVFELVNARYDQLVSGRKLVGKGVRDALPEVVGQGYIDLLDHVYRTGEAFVGTDARVTLEPGDGRPPEERFIDFVYQAMRDATGAVTGILVHGVDLTARRRAEEGLRASEERLRVAVAAAKLGQWTLDLRTQVMNCSDGCKANYGRRPDDSFTHEDLWAAVHPDDLDRVRAAVRAAVETRTDYDTEYRTVWPDGSQHWVLVRGRASYAPDGEPAGMTGVTLDITDRKLAEVREQKAASEAMAAAEAVRFLSDASASLAELVDYESTLHRIANLAVGRFADWCVVDVLDDAGNRRRLAVNGVEAATAASPGAAETAVGVPHVLKTGEPELVPDVAALDPATARQGPDRIEQLRGWGIESYLAVPLLSRGRVIGGMTFLSASARRRYGREELLIAQELAVRVTTAIENASLYRTLQDQDRRKDEFLATLAHELRNPLAPVRNGVQILRATLPGDDRTGKTLSMMDRQLGHMVHLVDDLMDVARVSSGKVVLRKERVELRAVVDAAVESTRQTVEAGGHELAVDLPAEPLVFDADKTRLVQVLANLLSNAAKYTPHGGRIAVSARRADGHAEVRVADTGVGITAEMLPKVFEMFTQVGTSLERSQGGLGIGLTLVKRLVEMHGGSVSAESPGPGRGSTFVVRLPLADAATPLPSTGPPEETPAAARLRVLVVDDNVDAAVSLAMLLEMKGHEVRVAHDGPDALRVLGSYRPRLVVLDIGLPGMTGYEVARRIRASTELEGVALAALTGWGQDEDRRRSRAAGFDYHLTKPADPGEIDRILGEVSAT